jgi:hypothetical protein
LPVWPVPTRHAPYPGMVLAKRPNNTHPNNTTLLAPRALVVSRRRTIGNAFLGKLRKACRRVDGTIPSPADDLLGRLEHRVLTLVKEARQGDFVIAQFHRHSPLSRLAWRYDETGPPNWPETLVRTLREMWGAVFGVRIAWRRCAAGSGHRARRGGRGGGGSTRTDLVCSLHPRARPLDPSFHTPSHEELVVQFNQSLAKRAC